MGDGLTGYPPISALIWPVAVFFLATLVAILDRQILFLLVDQVSKDLQINDVQISLLEGAAFSICYASCALPIGLLADRYSRKTIAVCGILCWSAATVWGGFTNTFEEMFLSRVFVGLGEATLMPTAISFISDLAAPSKRGRPISFMLTGNSLGRGATILIVSGILAVAGSQQFFFSPWISDVAPWRLAFFVCGFLGLPVAVLLVTLREPPRRADGQQSRWDLRPALRYGLTHARVLLPFMFCSAALSIGNYGMAAWGPSLLIRHFDLTAIQVGAWYGPAMMVAGPLGSLTGGYLSDRASAVGGARARLLFMAIACLGFLPGAFAVFAPHWAGAIALIAFSTASFSITGAMHSTVAQDLVPGHMRSTMVGFQLLISTIIGFAGGPFVIALMTEHFFRDPSSVGYSMAATIPPAVVVAALLALMSWSALRGRPTIPG